MIWFALALALGAYPEKLQPRVDSCLTKKTPGLCGQVLTELLKERSKLTADQDDELALFTVSCTPDKATGRDQAGCLGMLRYIDLRVASVRPAVAALLEAHDAQPPRGGGSLTEQRWAEVKAALAAAAGAKADDADVVATLAQLGAQGSNGLDLSRRRLKGIDLTGRKLVGVKLDGAQLENAKLAKADLTGASLQGATLRNATLDGAVLERANLSNTDLTSASLTRVTGDATVYDGARLHKTKLEPTGHRLRFHGAVLDGVEATLSGGELSFEGASLSNGLLWFFHPASLTRATVRKMRLEFAEGPVSLVGAKMTASTLKFTNRLPLDASGVVLEDVLLECFGLKETKLSGAQLLRVDLNSCQLENATMNGGVLEDVKATSMHGGFRGGVISGVRFRQLVELSFAGKPTILDANDFCGCVQCSVDTGRGTLDLRKNLCPEKTKE